MITVRLPDRGSRSRLFKKLTVALNITLGILKGYMYMHVRALPIEPRGMAGLALLVCNISIH